MWGTCQEHTFLVELRYQPQSPSEMTLVRAFAFPHILLSQGLEQASVSLPCFVCFSMTPLFLLVFVGTRLAVLPDQCSGGKGKPSHTLEDSFPSLLH